MSNISPWYKVASYKAYDLAYNTPICIQRNTQLNVMQSCRWSDLPSRLFLFYRPTPVSSELGQRGIELVHQSIANTFWIVLLHILAGVGMRLCGWTANSRVFCRSTENLTVTGGWNAVETYPTFMLS